ncbi:MAG TPA: sel1 repeat family protein [Planctomycetaceae bacterium]|nr:sel1 repeat family protein [Planctomycetaceae bacterium]
MKRAVFLSFLPLLFCTISVHAAESTSKEPTKFDVPVGADKYADGGGNPLNFAKNDTEDLQGKTMQTTGISQSRRFGSRFSRRVNRRVSGQPQRNRYTDFVLVDDTRHHQVKADYEESLTWANRGESEAFFEDRHRTRLLAWKDAAERGISEGQGLYGCCLYYGTGVAKNLTEAVQWFRKAAEQGNAGAQASLGVCYANGTGVPKDEAEGVKWIRKAAEQGNALGQSWLGLCYLRGIGVAKDEAEAVKWLRKAAEQGYAYAKEKLKECGLE